MKVTYRPLMVTLAKRGLKGKDLMVMTGISQPVMSKMSQDKGDKITVETIIRIKVALDVSLDEICEPLIEGEVL